MANGSESGGRLAESFDQGLGMVQAVLLAGDRERVTVGYQELELSFDWAGLGQAVQGIDPDLWPAALSEAVIEAAAHARAVDDSWSALKYRVLPLLLNETAAQELARRSPDILAYPYASVLLIALVYSVEAGWRYVLRTQLDLWGVQGGAVIGAAIENLRRDTPREAVQAMDEDHYALDTGDGLDASRILIVDELIPAGRECGLVVAVPARDVLTFAPFNRRGCQHLRGLVLLAHKCYRSWPHPISDSLFYIAPHTALHIAITKDDDGTPRLTFPAHLAQIQADLVDKGEW